MRVITTFESKPPGEKPSTGNYTDILKAIPHNQEVAENAFARLAKADLQKRLEGIHTILGTMEEYAQYSPLWVSDLSVVLWFSDSEEETLKQSALLGELVAMLADELLMKGDSSKELVLVDPLGIRIQRVSTHHYRCGVKQKWARK
jgi:hypothetical protein